MLNCLIHQPGYLVGGYTLRPTFVDQSISSITRPAYCFLLYIAYRLSVVTRMREPDEVSRFAMSTSHPAALIRSMQSPH